MTAGAKPLGETAYSPPNDAVWVSPGGDDSASGGKSTPVRTFTRAAAVAPPGATVVMRGGLYPETCYLSANKPLSIQAAPGEAVWWVGSDVVDGWKRDGAAWYRDGWTTRFDHWLPTDELLDPSCPQAHWADQVWMGGQPLTLVASREEVVPGTFWIDEAADVLWIGDDPDDYADDPTWRAVRASVRGDALIANPKVTVRGIGFAHYGTNQRQLGACRSFAEGSLWEHCVFLENAASGLHVQATSGGMVICCDFVGNGQMGLRGFGWKHAIVNACLFRGNNRCRFATVGAAGGMKLDTECTSALIVGNHCVDNHGHGLWLDLSSHDARMVRNTVEGHAAGAGIFFEMSERAILAGNVVSNCYHGVLVSESGSAGVWNNTLVDCRNPVIVQLGKRADHRGFVVRNNLIIERTPGVMDAALTAVDTRGNERDYLAMGLDSDHNAVHFASPPDGCLVAKVTLPDRRPHTFGTWESLTVATGLDVHSVSASGGDNPWRDAAGTALPMVHGIGTAVPGDVAKALGWNAAVAADPPIGAAPAVFVAPPDGCVYLGATGDDNADGLSASTAKKTLPGALRALGNAPGTLRLTQGPVELREGVSIDVA